MTMALPITFRIVGIGIVFTLYGAAIAAESPATGSIKGVVRFEGTPPQPQRRRITRDHESCGAGYRDFVPVRTGKDGGLQDAVVYLDSKIIGGAWNYPKEGYVLSQTGCAFEPYLLIFPKDPKSRLRIVNNDATTHNVRIEQRVGRVRHTLLNLSQPKDARTKEKALRFKPGSNVLSVSCDAHEFMEAWIFAPDNPYYARVHEDGSFQIYGVPTGEHVIKAWHPYLVIESKTIRVTESQTARLDFQLRLDVKVKRR